MVSRPVTVNDVLDGHVALDLECLDRIYLNGYVPNLQVGGQVVAFLTAHLGFPIPSPAIFEKIGTRFRRAVAAFAEDNADPGGPVRQGRPQDRGDGARIWQAGRHGRGRGWPRSGWRRSSSEVFSATGVRGENGGAPRFSFAKADRRVTCYYFYLWDDDFGPAFIKVCCLLPVPDQDLGQRARVGQAAGHQGRDRVHRAVQRVRRLRRPGRAAGDLRPARPGHDRGVLRSAGGRGCRCR